MFRPVIYSASKIWHNKKWRELRDKYTFNIKAGWIDFECGEEGDQTGAKLLTPEEKTKLWVDCQREVCTANMVVLYCEKREEQRGGLVEFGMMLGAAFFAPEPKPIYVIGNCASIEPNAISDVAFMHHPMVHRVPVTQYTDGSFDHLNGYRGAVRHYMENYYSKFINVAKERVFYHEGFTGSQSGFQQKTVADSLELLRTQETALYKVD